MPDPLSQMRLDLPVPDLPADMADFLVAPSNQQARHFLARTASWPAGRLALHGPDGSGKTHLARAWAGSGLYLRGASLAPPASAPACARVVIDEADAAPDHALLHWLNSCAEQGCALLLVARTPPARFAHTLPDLVSRLRATTAVGLAPPEDALLHALLVRALAARQMRIDTSVQLWLLARLPRNAAAVLAAVARLDAASLTAASLGAQPRITRAFARASLAPMLSPEDGAEPANPMPPNPAMTPP